MISRPKRPVPPRRPRKASSTEKESQGVSPRRHPQFRGVRTSEEPHKAEPKKKAEPRKKMATEPWKKAELKEKPDAKRPKKAAPKKRKPEVVQGKPPSVSQVRNHNRKTIRITVPSGWARSILAGCETAFIGWGLCILLAVAGVYGVSKNPWLGKLTWNDSLGIGGDLWAAALGAPLRIGDVTYDAIPVLFPVVMVVMLWALLLPGRRFSNAAQWLAIPSFMGVSTLLLSATATRVSPLHTLSGAFLVSLLAVLWAVIPRSATVTHWGRRWAWLPSGLRQARLILSVLGVAGLAALIWSVLKSGERISGITELLFLEPQQSIIVWIGQVLFIPSALAWALSWMAGPGFLLGTDAPHSPAIAVDAPIPAIPLLGATPSTAPGYTVVLVMVLLGVVCGAWIIWRHRMEHVLDQLWSALVCLGVCAVVIAAWMKVSVLSLGVQRLSYMGPPLILATLFICLEVVVVAQLLAVGTHRVFVVPARAKVAPLIARIRIPDHFGNSRSATGDVHASGIDKDDFFLSQDDEKTGGIDVEGVGLEAENSSETDGSNTPGVSDNIERLAATLPPVVEDLSDDDDTEQIRF